MYAFTYLRPATLEQAVAALRADPEAKLLAGGQTLLPSLKLRLAAPRQLIDLRSIAELNGIVQNGNSIQIKAMTPHARVAADALVQQKLPMLAALAGGIGDRMVRNLGTVGGSIANNDPAADYPAALLALDAVVLTSTRRIAAADFFRGLFATALQSDEVVTAVEFPIPRRAAYLKFRHPASRFAMVGVLVADTANGPRVAVTGAGAGVFRVAQMEAALKQNFSAAALRDISVSSDGLNSDLHASAEYRANLIKVLAERAVTMVA